MDANGISRAEDSIVHPPFRIKDDQVQSHALPLRAAILGLGLLCASQLAAQSTASGTATQSSTGGSTSAGGVVNMPKEAPPREAWGNSGQIQMKDLLNYKIRAQDGAFGRVSDVVFDRNGNVQYLLGSHEGKTFPLPFTPSAFSGAANTMSFDVPMATLQQMAINPNQLPTMNNLAFMQRMQQVFGSSFGANSGGQNAAGSSGVNGSGGVNNQGSNQAGAGRFESTNGVVRGVGNRSAATDVAGGALAGGGAKTGGDANVGNQTKDRNGFTGTGRFESENGVVRGVGDRSAATDVAGGAVAGGGTKVGDAASGGGANIGANGGAATGNAANGSSQDSWAWPNGSMNGMGTGTAAGAGTSTIPALPAGSQGRLPAPPPGVKSFSPNSKSGTGNNSGVGTGGRSENEPPNGIGNGQNGTGSKMGNGSKTGTGSNSSTRNKTGNGNNSTEGAGGTGGSSGNGGNAGSSGGSGTGSSSGSGS